LKGLEVLDLSHNNLSGNIPQFLVGMKGLNSLNLSFNYFESEVPKDGIFLNVSAVDIEGNQGLCGGISELKLHRCSTQTAKSQSWKVITVSIISAVLLLAILLALFTFWYNRSKLRRANTDQSLISDLHIRLGYAELVHATNGFASGNLIGEGSFGSVYKERMMLHDQQVDYCCESASYAKTWGGSKLCCRMRDCEKRPASEPCEGLDGLLKY
jgi:hypothetical protein